MFHVRITASSLGFLLRSRPNLPVLRSLAASATEPIAKPSATLPKLKVRTDKQKDKKEGGDEKSLVDENEDALKPLTAKEKGNIKGLMKLFFRSSLSKEMAMRKGTPPQVFEKSQDSFLEYVLKDVVTSRQLTQPQNRHLIMSQFMKYVQTHHKSEMDRHKAFQPFADLTKPHLDYPLAREIKRKIIYNYGPTNSGKTHDAMEKLKMAQMGIYCAPLRLLALENFQKLNAAGVKCNLITGQEKRFIEGATVSSCTVEVTNLDFSFDVAVIDEIQMIGDPTRSFSWTNALLGLRAKEIYLCGDDTALDLVKTVVSMTGDELEVRAFERLSPLKIVPPIKSLKNIQEADAVIAFSRNDLHALKGRIESQKKHKCAIVYGKLPPEVRSSQAGLFNSAGSGADVLVASDAIGMGLNLNIKRVVFTTFSKYNGKKETPLSDSQIRQIAGRAGRANGVYPEGEVTCIDPADMNILRRALNSGPLPKIKKAGLSLTFDKIEAYSNQFPSNLSKIIDHLEYISFCDKNFFLCELHEFKAIASAVSEYANNLPLFDQYTLCKAPLDATEPREKEILIDYLKYLAKGELVPFRLSPPEEVHREAPLNTRVLGRCEQFIRDAECYLWLSERFEQFKEAEYVRHVRQKVIDKINMTFIKDFDVSALGKDETFPCEEAEDFLEEGNKMQALEVETESEVEAPREQRGIDLSISLAKMAKDYDITK